MNRAYKIPLIFFTVLLFFSSIALPSLAASTNFFTNAQQYYKRVCVRKPTRVDGSQAILCYTFDKVNELDTALASLENKVSGQQGDIDELKERNIQLQSRLDDLESRVASLETTPTPPKTITIADNLPQGTNGSAVTIPDGYTSMTWHVNGAIVGYSVHVSFDNGSTWLEQVRVGCGNGICPTITVPILSHTYRISLGSGSSSVDATATLQSGGSVLVLGHGMAYPFTSAGFDVGQATSIMITAGGGDNPQHVTGISLQHFENGSYVQVHHANCDGGATCPITTFSVTGGTYRVVLEGNGTNAVLGALLE